MSGKRLPGADLSIREKPHLDAGGCKMPPLDNRPGRSGDGSDPWDFGRPLAVAIPILGLILLGGFYLVATWLPGRYDTALAKDSYVAPGLLNSATTPQVVEVSANAGTAWMLAEANLLLEERHWTRRQENDTARVLLEHVIGLDPGNADAYASLALTYWLEVENLNWGGGPEEMQQALELAETSVELGAGPAAYRLLAQMRALAPWPEMLNPAEALVSARTAVELEPDQPDNLAVLAEVLALTGSVVDSIELIEMARELNPDPPPWYGYVAGVSYLLGELPDLAIDEFSALYSPGDYDHVRSWPGWLLVSSLAHAGRIEEASELLQSILGPMAGAGARMQRFSLNWVHLPEQEDYIFEGLMMAQEGD